VLHFTSAIVGLGRPSSSSFISSASVGVVWTAVSPVVGFGLAAVLMAAGTLTLLRVKGN